MQFIDSIKQQAKQEIKTIVLPEGNEIRTLKATEIVLKEKFANIILLGNEEEILKLITDNNISITGAKIINPIKSQKYNEYVEKFYELRKHKGITVEESKKLMKDTIYFGMMMVKNEDADGLVSGAIHSSADTLRPALQILKTAPNTKIVSSFFIMCVPNCELGENGTFIFSDCALVENPTSEELSEIAVASARTFKKLVGKDATVGMLSYSTYDSAKSEMVDKVKEATKLVKQNYPDIKVDGELQLDSAIIPEVAELKAKGSKIAGKCNTLIFPDINSGNIGYKLVQRLAKAEAYGPLCQGIAKPVNDLSRGCVSEDIVGVIAITAVQAQNKREEI